MKTKTRQRRNPGAYQNVFFSGKWGRLYFVPVDSDRWSDTCRHCPLWVPRQLQSPLDECMDAPCTKERRHDGRQGYFAIQKMPEKM